MANIKSVSELSDEKRKEREAFLNQPEFEDGNKRFAGWLWDMAEAGNIQNVSKEEQKEVCERIMEKMGAFKPRSMRIR